MALRMITSLNTADIVSSKVNTNKYGGKAIYLNGPGKSRLMFQLPALKAIVGLKPNLDEKTGKVLSYSMPLSLDNPQLVDILQKVDSYALDLIAENSLDLLGKKMSRDVIEAGDSWKPLVKQSKKEGYAPLLTLKPMLDSDGKITTEAYNSERQLVDLAILEKGQRVNCIIEIAQIWRTAMGFGVSVRLHKVMMAPTQKLVGCAFLPEADTPVVESEEGEGSEDASEVSVSDEE